ncbi:hypothetical protein C5F29_13125 [Escherichia coli]|uniref:Uncharacterized protein n=1 Tax=Escherichia coli TaxID=562 RepID=A0A5B9SY40_ECOLX|nr:hypothetical protein [Escherichia coli]KUS12233.1 hypothetical protein AWE62_22765 [Escherichia coli]PQA32694.1 hypothetical protein C5F29_13125 [Escherichia coli]QEG95535.1 hypothetical protein EC0638J-ColB-ColM_00147 [Escherichia coli]GCO35952.1 hypothetical protein BvCms2125_04092 [Escherichia coli]
MPDLFNHSVTTLKRKENFLNEYLEKHRIIESEIKRYERFCVKKILLKLERVQIRRDIKYIIDNDLFC